MGRAQLRPPGRHKAQCGGRYGTVGRSPQRQSPAVSVETEGRGVCWLLWGLQCKRAGGTTSTGLGWPRGSPWVKPQEGHVWAQAELVARADVQSWQAWATEGTIVVSGRSGLGRHVDVPESNGAAGGLVPEQQGRRVHVPLGFCSSTTLLCTGLCAGTQALGQDLLDGPAQVGVQPALCLVEDFQRKGLEGTSAEVLIQRDGVHAGHLGGGTWVTLAALLPLLQPTCPGPRLSVPKGGPLLAFHPHYRPSAEGAWAGGTDGTGQRGLCRPGTVRLLRSSDAPGAQARCPNAHRPGPSGPRPPDCSQRVLSRHSLPRTRGGGRRRFGLFPCGTHPTANPDAKSSPPHSLGCPA